MEVSEKSREAAQISKAKAMDAVSEGMMIYMSLSLYSGHILPVHLSKLIDLSLSHFFLST